MVGERQRVTVLANSIVDVGTIRLARPYRLEGRVRSQTIDPRLLTVVISNPEKHWNCAPAGESGEFQVDLPRGEYMLQLWGQGGFVHSQVVTVPTAPLDIEIDPRLAALRFVNVPEDIGAELDTWLIEANDASLEMSSRPVAFFVSGASSPSRIVRSKGAVSVKGLRPGIYGVALRTRSAASDRWWENVVLLPGETMELAYASHESGSIRARVSTPDGEPVSGCIVCCDIDVFHYSRGKAEPREFLTDTDGYVVFKGLSAGRWLVYSKDLSAVSAERVTLKVDEAVDTVITVPGRGAVKGTITSDGLPCSGLYVSVIPPAALRIGVDGPGRVVIGENGTYEFSSIVAGRYTLIVTGGGPPTINRARSIDVHPGQTTIADVELNRPTVTYRLIDEQGPVTNFVAGSVLLAQGWGPLNVLDAVHGEVRSDRGDGPWVLRLCPRLWRMDPLQPKPDGYRMAYVAEPPQSDGALVDISGVTLRVEGTGLDPLPQVYLVSVGEWRSADTLTSESRVLYEQESARGRVFRNVPRGSRLRLVEPNPYSDYSGREMVIDIWSDRSLDWPARE